MAIPGMIVDAANVDWAYTDGAYDDGACTSWLSDDVDALEVCPRNGWLGLRSGGTRSNPNEELRREEVSK
jgi:hypothetical protein